jgi:hypothetical protein
MSGWSNSLLDAGPLERRHLVEAWSYVMHDQSHVGQYCKPPCECQSKAVMIASAYRGAWPVEIHSDNAEPIVNETISSYAFPVSRSIPFRAICPRKG